MRNVNIKSKEHLESSVKIAFRDFFKQRNIKIAPESRDKLVEILNGRWNNYIDNRLGTIKQGLKKKADEITDYIVDSVIVEIGKYCYELGKRGEDFTLDSIIKKLQYDRKTN